jgi:hypothetical protein
VTGVLSVTSVTLVDTGVLIGTSFSKLPPATPVMLLSTGALPLITSSGAVVVTVPLVLPTSMVMVSPFFSVTLTALPVTAVGTVAV